VGRKGEGPVMYMKKKGLRVIFKPGKGRDQRKTVLRGKGREAYGLPLLQWGRKRYRTSAKWKRGRCAWFPKEWKKKKGVLFRRDKNGGKARRGEPFASSNEKEGGGDSARSLAGGKKGRKADRVYIALQKESCHISLGEREERGGSAGQYHILAEEEKKTKKEEEEIIDTKRPQGKVRDLNGKKGRKNVFTGRGKKKDSTLSAAAAGGRGAGLRKAHPDHAGGGRGKKKRKR